MVDRGSPIGVGSDRIDLTTRVLAAGIVPFLILGVYALYFRTGQTRQLWTWEIRSPMSALILASAYAGGAYYFTRAALARRWHHIGLGLLAVLVFATLMAVVTVGHWSQFIHTNIAFPLWTGLYFITPVLVLAAWLGNRRADPGSPDDGDVILPPALRRVSRAAGVAGLVANAVFLSFPSLLIAVWAWPLTPLTARVLCVIFALFDVYLLCLGSDPRWSAARINIESFAVAALFILVGIIRTSATFLWSRPAAWAFTVGTAGTLVLAVWSLVAMRPGRSRDVPSA